MARNGGFSALTTMAAKCSAAKRLVPTVPMVTVVATSTPINTGSVQRKQHGVWCDTVMLEWPPLAVFLVQGGLSGLVVGNSAGHRVVGERLADQRGDVTQHEKLI